MAITANTLKVDRSKKSIVGNWTSTVGDESFTHVVAGDVVSAKFEDQDPSTDGKAQLAPISVSFDTGTSRSTITVYPKRTVTRGRFEIIYR